MSCVVMSCHSMFAFAVPVRRTVHFLSLSVLVKPLKVLVLATEAILV